MFAALGVILCIFLRVTVTYGADPDSTKDWWEVASIYQIYPRSFKDSNGDGIGDLKGITEMLPYLKEIGVDAAWMSPIFKSPNADFGYDIADYFTIQPEYGTYADFDELMSKAKEIGVKILLDFVPNHTSDECEWFQKSLKKEAGYEDFYVWHPGYPDPNNSSNRLPPSNWVSRFRFSAWEWRDERQEFYLHQFDVKQPDLNYRNPAVVQQMKDVMTFWLDRGVDGFRIDATPFLFEIAPNANNEYLDEPKTGLTDDPNAYEYLQHIYTQNQPETIGMIYEWRALVDDYLKAHGGETRVLLTEAYAPISVLMQYYGNGTNEGSHIPFNFLLITDLNIDSRAPDYVRVINSWLDAMPPGRTANWVLGNHDKHRVATRFGVEKVDMLNMLLMILPGVSCNYNGEEIGMTNVWISWQNTLDPEACNTNPTVYNDYSRDGERTPFQWDDTKNAGFSTASHTWLPVGPNYPQVNVETERRFVRSALNTYKRAKVLRKENKAFQDGGFNITAINENVLGIRRSLIGVRTFVMVANFGSQLERFSLDLLDISLDVMEVALSSAISPRRIGDRVDPRKMMLLPNEALFLRSEFLN